MAYAVFLLTFSLNFMGMNQRRKFIRQLGLLAGAFSANSLFNQLHAAEWKQAAQKVAGFSPETVAADEDYWS
ncbi:hypothetical protein FCL43_022650, partial [Enterobacter hormaechei]|nr:hypothetical protein [Enterobacter hormaechei]